MMKIDMKLYLIVKTPLDRSLSISENIIIWLPLVL